MSQFLNYSFNVCMIIINYCFSVYYINTNIKQHNMHRIEGNLFLIGGK
jgi:hypothetical protein